MKKPIIFLVIIFSISIYAQDKSTGKYYIRTSADTILTTPVGNPIGILNQFSEVDILEEDSIWVKVSVSGWTKKVNLKLIESEPFAAGNDFYYQKLNMQMDNFYGGTRVVGEILNNSDQNYKIASFTITLFDKDENILEASSLFFSNFNVKERMPFSEKFPNIPFNESNYIEIRYKIGGPQ